MQFYVEILQVNTQILLKMKEKQTQLATKWEVTLMHIKGLHTQV